MNFAQFLKHLKTLVAKGFATEAEKAEVKKTLKEFSEEEQEAAAGDADAVDELPTEDPAAAAADDEAQAEIEKSIKALIKSATAEVKDDIKEWLKSQETAREQKAGLYNPEVKANRAKLNEYMRDLTKALVSKDFAKVKELTTDESGSPYGGYAVDRELATEVHHLTTEYGVAAREFTAVTLSKHTYRAVDLATDVTVYWVDEGGDIASTQLVLGKEDLELNKLGAIVAFTNELLEDSEIDLMAFVATRVAEGFAEAEDDAFFNGDGTSTYGSFTGILNATDVNTVDMATAADAFEDMDADDLLDLQDATPQGALANGKYFMHRSVLNLVRKLKDSNGAYIYQNPGQGQPATLWDKPVVTVEVMPSTTDSAAETPFVVFGDARKGCIYGYRGGMGMDVFDAGVIRNVADDADINLITSDRKAIRFIKRVGYVRIIPTALTVLSTGPTS